MESWLKFYLSVCIICLVLVQERKRIKKTLMLIKKMCFSKIKWNDCRFWWLLIILFCCDWEVNTVDIIAGQGCSLSMHRTLKNTHFISITCVCWMLLSLVRCNGIQSLISVQQVCVHVQLTAFNHCSKKHGNLCHRYTPLRLQPNKMRTQSFLLFRFVCLFHWVHLFIVL